MMINELGGIGDDDASNAAEDGVERADEIR